MNMNEYQYQQPGGYPPGYGQPVPGGPQHKQGGGGELAVVSLVLGILSIVLSCLFGLGSGVLGIAGLVVGIISCARHEAKRGMAIGGIVTSAVGIVLLLVFVIMLQFVMRESVTDYLEDYEADLNMGQEQYFAEPEDEDPFAGNRFAAGDDSIIYFGSDESFLWYQDDENHGDNYYQGTYTTYRGEEAVGVLNHELAEYGVTEQEMEDYFARNAGSPVYLEENFTVLILRTERAVIDGEEQERNPPTKRHYMGFFSEDYGYYDAVNMDSGEYAMFTAS